jgi:RNA polymerase sigma-70 factor (ECF subfamily)
VRRRVGHREDAEDIAQESWLRISSSAQRGEAAGFSHFRAYLFRIARNLIVDHRRRAAVKPFAEASDAAMAAVADPRPDPETALITRAELARMDRIIAAMPDKPREVYRLSRIEGLSFAEIGRRLGVSRQTVHEHMRKALLAVTLAADADF